MILVTGGAGFIGSNLVAGLCERGLDVAVCDGFGQGDKWRNLSRCQLADIVPHDQLFDWLEAARGSVEVIFHMGASSSTTETDIDYVVETNFVLSRRLWRWCADHGTRLIYASSAATYGDGGQGFDDSADARALAALKPLNAYGWTKHLFDRGAVRRAAEGDAPKQWAGLKFFNVYGPNEYHKGGQQSVAVQLFHQIRDGGRARLFCSHRDDYADGGQLRDFIWVGDCVDVMLWLYDNASVNGIFNCGTGEARSFSDLANACFAALDCEAKIDYVDTPANIRDKYQYFTQAEMARLRAAGYDKPFTSLEDGVARYIRDYLATDDPYR